MASSLRGVRVWLSGSVPEESYSTPEQRQAISSFVSGFSRRVFRSGGHVIHGSHPSFVPLLLREAKLHVEAGAGSKDCLTLAVSRFWSEKAADAPPEEWHKFAVVQETPKHQDGSRDSCLSVLREWMAARCDVLVAVGGKFWVEMPGKAGVPLEFDLAKQRGLPCFLLGGIGGKASEFLDAHPEMLEELKNGLDEPSNRTLASEQNAARLSDRVCEQMERLPLVRGTLADGSSFRILALDGGGIKGTFSASVLATLEKLTGTRICDQFDLLAGTSTGGIIALGLGVGKTAQQLLEFYKQMGPEIFPMMSFHRRFLLSIRHWFRPKFSQELLMTKLRERLSDGEKEFVLADAVCRLVIPAYHAVAGCTHIFRTPHHPLLTTHASTRVADVALATAAAPTYFSAAQITNEIAQSSYFDGGVWANAPALVAIVEAVCYLGVPMDRIDVLSVGTTDEPFTVKGQARSGILGWSKKLVHLLMSAQEQASLEHARRLLGEPKFLRINSILAPGSVSLDSVMQIQELADRGNLEASRAELLAQVKSRFLNGVKAAPWRNLSR